MAGAKKGKGGSKNNPTNKGGTQHSNLVLSDVCEACTDKCSKGIKYLERIHSGKAGIGIVCKK